MTNFPECGYLYIAYGETFIKEAIVSAKSLRQVDPDAHITIITNKKFKNNLFNNIRFIELQNITDRKDFKYRVDNIYKESPYNKTFYIDTDTYFFYACRELFELVDYFDILIAPAPADTHLVYRNKAPLEGYYPYNCGVIIYKRTIRCEMFFQKWNKIYKQKYEEKTFQNNELDQTAFMEALLDSEIRTYALPNMYNARLPFYISLNYEGCFVKLVHGRFSDYGKLKKRINNISKRRVWDPVKKKCISYELSTVYRFQNFFKNSIVRMKNKFQKTKTKLYISRKKTEN